MGEIRDERRCALRVPVRGFAVLHAESIGPLHGSLENLSQTGALLSVASRPPDNNLDLELRLSEGDGWVTARTVRVERVEARPMTGTRWKIAVVFDRVDPAMRTAIDTAIEHALSAAKRRPILVIDDRADRRMTLVKRLARDGMTPLAPKTPLEAIDLLGRSQLHISVCMLAPGFGVASRDLATILSDSFPWITTAEITDDIDDTATRAHAAWSETAVARIATAIS